MTPAVDTLPECDQCGATETIEIHAEDQSITICANCGSDE